MSARARKHHESYRAYQKAIRDEEYYLKRRLKGTRILYNSANRIPAMQVGTRMKPRYVPLSLRERLI